MLKPTWLRIIAVNLLLVTVSINGGEEDMFTQQRNGKFRKQFATLPSPPFKERKPNIVLILTDDQDVELGSLNFMPRTLRLLRDGGAEFRHAYTTTPMCCPSRSSLLTGLYMHNHHVYTNNDNCSSTQWQTTHETRSFATYLSNAGYRTGYFGKYLNKYNGSYIPPGWREWAGLIMNSRYYNYSVNFNGKRVKHGDDYHKDYYPDLIANDSVSFLRQSKKYFSRKPVLLVLSFPAPHGPEDSAPQYSEMFFNVTSHHTPSYDYAPNPDKQWILQVTNRMQPIHRQFTDLLMTKRLQTLQSVDDAVERIYNELDALGELDNTYIIYTSDHGYHLGQFGLVKGKSFPFEFDIRVPFLVRGPNIEPGTIVDELVLNIDLAPTFLDIAGVEVPSHMDGRSIMELLNRRRRRGNAAGGRKPASGGGTSRWPDTFLVESSGRRELPDSITEMRLQESIGRMEKDLNLTISGGGDVQLDNRLLPTVVGNSKSERLAVECVRPELQAPCKPGQKWHCVSDGNRWRKHKCKVRSRQGGAAANGDAKKCVCFTSAGVMYTPLLNAGEHNPFPRSYTNRGQASKDFRGSFRSKFHRGQSRSKRTPILVLPKEMQHSNNVYRSNPSPAGGSELDEWISLLDNNIGQAISSSCYGDGVSYVRCKRSGSRHASGHASALDSQVVSNMMDAIQDKLSGLQASTSNETDSLLGLDWNCTVSQSHDVICSDSLYNSPRQWQQSQHKIADQIRRLKSQLEKLKEIRKYLREKRPPQLPYDKSNEEEEDDDKNENEDYDEEEGSGDENEEGEKKSGVQNGSTEESRVEVRFHNTSDVEGADNNYNKNYTKDLNKEMSVVNLTQPNSHSTSTDDDGQETFVNNNNSVNTYKHRHNHPSHHPHRHQVINSATETTNHGHLNNKHQPNARHHTSVAGPGTNRHKETAPGRIDVTILEPVLNQNVHHHHHNRVRPPPQQHPLLLDTCYCEPDAPAAKDEKEMAKEARRRLKEERLRKKERKLRKKAKQESMCLSEKMNCFNHDNQHWRTPPYWTGGPFCFCMNANNNTYSCVRTINSTHNFLYCEFVTGSITFYNIRIDPFEQWNRVNSLTNEERSYLHDTLEHLKGCKGVRQCTVGRSSPPPPNPATNNHGSAFNKRRYQQT